MWSFWECWVSKKLPAEPVNLNDCSFSNSISSFHVIKHCLSGAPLREEHVTAPRWCTRKHGDANYRNTHDFTAWTSDKAEAAAHRATDMWTAIKERWKVTHPPAARQHPSSRGIRAFWEAAERRTAEDTSRGSPSERLTLPYRRLRCRLWAFYGDGPERAEAASLASSGGTSLSAGGAEVRLSCNDYLSPLGGAKGPLKCFQWRATGWKFRSRFIE